MVKRQIWVGFGLATLAGCGDPGAPPKLPLQPLIGVQAKQVSPYEIEITTSTNLPTPLAAMASLDLDGQKPDDTAVGHSEHVMLNGQSTTFRLALTDDVSGKPLPQSSYTASVQAGPKWKENATISALAENIVGETHLVLESDGDRSKLVRLDLLQKWVMENVGAGDAWDAKRFQKKLGRSERYSSSQSANLECFYFKDADMTIVVSEPLQKIVTWRRGRVRS